MQHSDCEARYVNPKAYQRRDSRDTGRRNILDQQLGSNTSVRKLLPLISKEGMSIGEKNLLECELTYQCITTMLRGAYDKFPDFFFFVWALLLIVHSWNSCPLRSNLLWLQCTCCIVPTTSGRLHGSPLVWACQWPSSQPISSPQLSHNHSLWA